MGQYSEIEEKVNVYSHLFGAILAIIGFVLLVGKAILTNGYDLKSQVGFIVFGVSLILLYLASAFYHNTIDLNLRFKRKVIDHCAIYILIAGTYTPYGLAVLKGNLGWAVFGLSWAMAAIGITLKLFFTGRFSIISTLMYILMGWMIVLFIKPLILALSQEGFNWLLAGGISYSVGAGFYLIRSMKFNHGVFHVFVLLGSICHFISIYFYI